MSDTRDSDLPVIRDNEGYRRFRTALQDGRLKAGMTVTQNELCELLGLSLSPLRETLVLLEEFGLVDIKPRTGIRIVYPEVAFIRENFQFRIMIETHAIRVFATIVEKEWLEEMRAAHEESRAELSVSGLAEEAQEAFLTLDRRMHRTFVEALDNRAILVTHNRLQDNISMARRVHQRSFKTQLMGTIEEHMNILDALAAHDIEAVVDTLGTHFRGATYRTFAAS